MIKFTIDDTGVMSSFNELEKMLTEVDTIGRILYYAASVIWVENIERRLNRSTAKSNYRDFLNLNFADTDPDFVALLGDGAWAYKTDAERRVPGGYREGEITEAISSAIKASIPIKSEGFIGVGIANIEDLNNLAGIVGTNSKYPIWQILQWGTGEYAGNAATVRTGKQIFFDGQTQRGVLVGEHMMSFGDSTINRGFEGRQYFVQLSGDMHLSDFVTVEYVKQYMSEVIKKISYR